MKLSVINCIQKYIENKWPNKYNFSHFNQKYELNILIKEILYILKTGISWRNYRGNIKWFSLYSHFSFFSKNNVFFECYKLLINKYYNNKKATKLKYQFTDTSFIQNMFGVNKIARNKYFKNKKVNKLSFWTDKDGIPISILVKKGNIHDLQFVNEHLNTLLIVTNTHKYKNNNRFKQYLMADKGYDSKKIRKQLSDFGYTVIIPYNKRNTKNINKINKLTNKFKKLYKKRIRVENIFCYIKKYRRINLRYEKNINIYISFLFLALCDYLQKKLII